MNRYCIFIFSIAYLHAGETSQSSRNFLFDLSVLLQLNEWTHAQNLGASLLTYTGWHWRNPSDLPEKFMKILDRDGVQKDVPDEECQRDEKERKFPTIVCNLRTGKINPAQALARFQELLSASHAEEPISPTHTDDVDKSMLENVAQCAFDPKSHVGALQPVAAAIALLNQLRSKTKVAIAATLDPETFDVLQRDAKFTQFTNLPVVVTGKLGFAPPQKEFFAGALAQLQWTKENCTYIGSCTTDVAGAQRFELRALQWKHNLSVENLLSTHATQQ